MRKFVSQTFAAVVYVPLSGLLLCVWQGFCPIALCTIHPRLFNDDSYRTRLAHCVPRMASSKMMARGSRVV